MTRASARPSNLALTLTLALALLLVGEPALAQPCTVLGTPITSQFPTNPGRSLAEGDFDEDGTLDLAVVGTNGLGIHLGTDSLGVGNGRFGWPTQYPLAGAGFYVAVHDFDSDGILDVVVSTGSTVSVRRGNGVGGVGDGTFGPAVDYATAGTTRGIVVADFDEDGVADLAVANNSTDNVSILLGNGVDGMGDGTFAPSVHYAVGSTPVRLATGDFDADGIVDLAVVNDGNSSQSVSILLGQGAGDVGNGTFAPAVDYLVATNSNPYGIATGDFDEDGITDLAVSVNIAGGLRILRGNGTLGAGNGTFAPAVAYGGPIAATLRDVAVTDLDQDGIADVILVDQTHSDLLWFRGQGAAGVGNGTFQAAVKYDTPAGPEGLVVADFLEDGIPDVVSVQLLATNITRFAGGCAGALAAPAVIEPVGGDLLHPGFTNSIRWTAPGAVDVELSRDGGANYRAIARDVTRDNFQWNTTAPHTSAAKVRVRDSSLQNRSAASDGLFTVCPLFATAVATGGLSKPQGALSGDFNEDGIRDLAVAESTGTVAILVGGGPGGVGDGSFAPPVRYSIGGVAGKLGSGDFNGDGIEDLAILRPTAQVAHILRGQGAGGVGNGTFGEGMDVLVGGGPTDLVVADFDEDGILDLATSHFQSASISLVRGQGANGVGNGNFANRTSLGLGQGETAIAQGDFDEDGIRDLVVVRPQGMTVFLGAGVGGDGNGTFDQVNLSPLPGSAFDVVVADFDRDGISDLAIAGSAPTNVPGVAVVLVVRRGLGTGGVGNGSFSTSGTYAIPAPATPAELAVADFNADGFPDLALSFTASDSIRVFLGDALGEFSMPGVVGVGDGPGALVVDDFVEDGRPDVATAHRYGNEVRVLPADCSATPAAELTLLTANGGESWRVGSERTVRWTKGAGILAVDVDVSRDGGANWQRIASDWTDTVFVWTVTPPTTATALLRVSDSTVPGIVDPSDAVFTICGAMRDGPGTVAYPGFANPFDVATGDFNGDGIADLVSAEAGISVLRVFLGQGNGGFDLGVPYIRPDGGASCVIVAEVTGDGIADLVSGGTNGPGIFAGVGNGSFVFTSTLSQGSATSAVVVGDFNEDGIQDLVATSKVSNFVQVWPGQGSGGSNDGTFGAPSSYDQNLGANDLLVADFDEDGIQDLAIGLLAGIGIRRGLGIAGHGDGTFGAMAFHAPGDAPNSLATADFDDDGRLDLAFVNSTQCKILLGNGVGTVGNGTFGAAVGYAAGAGAVSLIAGDFDADGITDAAVARSGQPSHLTLLPGNGNGTLGLPLDVPIGRQTSSLVARDFDLDGTVDFAAPGRDSLAILLGACAGPALALAVSAPAGGENWPVNSEQMVAWESGESAAIAGPPAATLAAQNLALDVSRDDGAHWERVASGLDGEQFVTWTVTGPPTTDARVRIYEENVPSRSAVSERFTIAGSLVDVPPIATPSIAFLGQPRPNPTRGSVRVQLGLPAGGEGSARIYEASGRLVRELARGALGPGVHDLVWDGRDLAGRRAPAGVYFLEARYPGIDGTRKLLLRR